MLLLLKLLDQSTANMDNEMKRGHNSSAKKLTKQFKLDEKENMEEVEDDE